MLFSANMASPVGRLTLASTENALVGLWIDGQKYENVGPFLQNESLPVLRDGIDWVQAYFSGKRPSISSLSLAPFGSPFRQTVWHILAQIPYGHLVTYGFVATEAAKSMGKAHMSAQAAGGAVGHNPLSIILPCHRVVGANGSLTGYAGGIEKKIALLRHEGVDLSHLFIPKESTTK